MPDALFHKAINSAHEHAMSLTIGFFGEQLLHKNFDALIQSVPRKDRKFVFILNTNWSRITEESLDTLRMFNSVRISIDSTDADKWESLCPGGPVLDHKGKVTGGRYQMLMDKIKWWLKIPQRPPTMLIFVTQDDNKAEAKAFGESWIPHLRKGDQAVTKTIITYGGVMLDPYMSNHGCTVAQGNRFTIAWDGRCTPCNLDVNLAMATHNLNTHSVPEIINSPEWKTQLDNIKAKRGICANCFDAQNHGQTFYNPL
jgi:sulfatase maturation enzyme AslB (radical SAM superfamily)